MTFSCNEETPVIINKDIINKPYYLQFDLIDIQTGDSTRITRQYNIDYVEFNLKGNTDSQTVIKSVITNTGKHETNPNGNAESAVFITFIKRIQIPLPTDEAKKQQLKDSVRNLFQAKSYTYSTFDTIAQALTEGVCIGDGNYLTSTPGKSQFIGNYHVDNTQSNFTIHSVTLLPKPERGYSTIVKGTFNCRLIDWKNGKHLALKNGQFSALVINNL